MTPEKYERLKNMIDDLLPARKWLREQMFAEGQTKTCLNIEFKTPETIFISRHATIGEGTVIHGNVSIRGESSIGENCILENCHLTNARLGDYVFIGPYAQISESEIGDGTDIPHHSYIGNAVIGKYCNIGDAVTTSNFDGIRKHQTVIEDGCFIGTQMKIVPPVIIGRESYVAARELKTDIPPHSFVVQGVKVKIKDANWHKQIVDAEGFTDTRGFLIEDIKPNRSFQLMPGKWLWTKKPVAPELMYELREKIADMYPEQSDWWKLYSSQLPIFRGKTTLEAIQSDGEKAIRELIVLLRRTKHGVFS